MGANNGSNGHGMSMSHDNGPSAGEGSWIEENRRVLGWVAELLNGSSRETALMELSKKREQVPELAMIIWHSFGRFTTNDLKWRVSDQVAGVMTSLLQEIISVYPLLNPSQLTAAASNRVCNALALLQCVASHNETRGLFLSGMYIYLENETPTTDLYSSTYPSVPISFPQYHIEIATIRIPAPDFSGRHWRVGQE